MYEASKAFHDAVAAGNHQLPLLIFKDAVFSDQDIDVDVGIEMDDYFNTEDDISIGQVPMNEIRFTLFNDDRLLNDYAFGEFTATIGVLVGINTYQQFGTVMLTTNYASWIGANEYPFVRRNNMVVSQPSFAVKSMLGYEGKVYVFGSNRQYAVYDDTTGENITNRVQVNAFMRKKSMNWNGIGFFYNSASRILFVYEAGYRSRYEFVPLGVFEAERPDVPDQIRISMTCYDRMDLLDNDMPTAEQLGISYPITLRRLLEAICNYFHVPLGTTSFPNSEATIDEQPEVFENATARTVVGWIAEAAGKNARFNRDGKLVMDWIHSAGASMNEGGYSGFDPYWYRTKTVDKLYNRDTAGSEEKTFGSGENGYLIQDNPFLIGCE